MAKRGPDELLIAVDNSGGTPVQMESFVDEQSTLDIEAISEESTTFGVSFTESLYTGIQRAGGLTLSGFFDDTATTGPDAIFNSLGDTRTVTITWGGSKTTSFEAIIMNYTRTPTRNQSTRYSVILMPTGTITEV